MTPSERRELADCDQIFCCRFRRGRLNRAPIHEHSAPWHPGTLATASQQRTPERSDLLCFWRSVLSICFSSLYLLPVPATHPPRPSIPSWRSSAAAMRAIDCCMLCVHGSVLGRPLGASAIGRAPVSSAASYEAASRIRSSPSPQLFSPARYIPILLLTSSS